MNEEELIEDIQTIFEKELSDLKNVKKPINEEIWRLDYSTKKIIYPNAELLMKIGYSISDEKLKNKFRDKLIADMFTQESRSYLNTYISISHLCFYALFKMNFVSDVLTNLERRNKNGYRSTLILLLISTNKDEFISGLTKMQLNRIYHIIEDFNIEYDFTIEKTNLLQILLTQRVERLNNNLNKLNTEINQDKTTLIKQISDWGFDEKYNILLDNIDKYLHSDDPHINSGMINNLRTFMCNFVIEIADKISNTEKEEIPKTDGCQEIGNCRNYIKNKLNLSKEENNLYNNLISILASEGGHSFATDKEYLRLARNIVIELALFLMTKYSRKYPQNKSKKNTIIKLANFSK